MEKVEKILLDRFYQEFWIFLVLLILSVLMLIILIVFGFIKFKKVGVQFRVGMLVAGVILIILSCSNSMLFSKYYKDYVYLKSNAPIQIEGKVVGYASAVSGDDLTVTQAWPVVLIDETKEQISLNVIQAEKKLQIDQKYKFFYLPNTKIAEIIE